MIGECYNNIKKRRVPYLTDQVDHKTSLQTVCSKSDAIMYLIASTILISIGLVLCRKFALLSSFILNINDEKLHEDQNCNFFKESIHLIDFPLGNGGWSQW